MDPARSFSEPLVFAPIYQQRVWGGRKLETGLGRTLPDAEQPYGESWEISDRPDAESKVISGPAPLIGRTLGDLWRDSDSGLRGALFGDPGPGEGPFPLLCKILDARERLSLQVHPPAEVAPELGGEPKTEMWVVAAADPGAELIVGLRAGVSRDAFEKALEEGTAEELVHKLPVSVGDFLFIPSGRLHAIGGGLLIFEIQQNSDTTYRVFDWNRVGLDGKPRDLHVEESLRCIDFEDIEPEAGKPFGDVLVDCPYFQVERRIGTEIDIADDRAAIITVVSGEVRATETGPTFAAGDFFLMPAKWEGEKRLRSEDGVSTVLVTTW